MLKSRIDTDRIYTRPEERAELTHLGTELDEVLLVVTRLKGVKPQPEYFRPQTQLSAHTD